MVFFLEKKLAKNNIPFYRYKRLPLLKWLKVLAHSKMIVISSLNGQFTPQIISCLSAGALCFVDELSSQTYLYRFFEPGKHLIIWCNFEDLLKKLIYYYEHPDEAEAIAKAGKLQAEKKIATTKSHMFTMLDFIYDNKIGSSFVAINDKRCQNERIESPEYFDARMRLYENIQELHRIHESLTLISITENNLKPLSDLADLPRLKITSAFITERTKNEADLYFQSVEVNNQIKTAILNKIKNKTPFDIGFLETPKNQANWEFLIKSISRLLKSNSLLWVLGDVTSMEKELLKREGFKPYIFNENSIFLKIKNISRKICFQSWKMGLYPFPYLTLKPAMEPVPNLNVFLRGWQAKIPMLF